MAQLVCCMIRIGPRLVSIIILILLIQLASVVRVSGTAAVAIVIYDHGLTKQVSYSSRGHFVPGNKTSTFTQNDSMVYAYFTAALTAANVTWLWYEPDGQLFQNQTMDYSCAVSPCTFVYTFPLAGNNAATMFGNWRVDMEAGGSLLYSDFFTLLPVVVQETSWQFTVLNSTPGQVHCDLTVTIHPNNQSWSQYIVNLPAAANITAYDAASLRPLTTSQPNSTSRIVVDFGGLRSDNYRFVLSFDVTYGFSYFGSWGDGNFAFSWSETSWGTFLDPFHPVPEAFSIELPPGATVVDVVGLNVLSINWNLSPSGRQPIVSFNKTLSPQDRFGWTVIYRDYTWRNEFQSTHPITEVAQPPGLNVISAQPLPVLSLTYGDLSLWSAVMSVFLLTASELLSPIYARTGIIINRTRLRIAAFVLVAIFVTVTAYQILLAQSAPQVGR